jgi:demethylmenaquinone methyltransferase / 2-methoxy-6-polyprenyl-1,4-benzoquinol methylase
MAQSLPHDTVTPYQTTNDSKKEQVAAMFNTISGKYDFFNRLLSFGIDVYWRKKALKKLKGAPINHMLDVATGTADVALLAHKILQPKKITGIDISEGMLDLGRKKIDKAGLKDVITLYTGDSETINFADNTFDAVTVAFGVRNFQDLRKGLKEIRRVLQPNGKMVILEFTTPQNNFFSKLYQWYTGKFSPTIVGWITGNKFAYKYLNDSVAAFPDRAALDSIIKECGFGQTEFKILTLGICGIYTATK